MTIVPRWEWRTFARDRDDLAAAFDGVGPERVEESDEEYLLSLHSDASAKVRGGRLDIKRLVDVRKDGLELWTPVLKATFPVAAPDVRFALSALGTVPPGLLREAYTRRQLLTELVPAHAHLRAVEVHKRRERYTAGGCLAELTTMDTGAGSVAPAPGLPSRIEFEWDRAQGATLHRHPFSRMAWRRAGRGATLFANGESWALPARDAQRLAGARVIGERDYTSLSDAGRDRAYALLEAGHYLLQRIGDEDE